MHAGDKYRPLFGIKPPHGQPADPGGQARMHMQHVRPLLPQPVAKVADAGQRSNAFPAYGPVQVPCAAGIDACFEGTAGGDYGYAVTCPAEIFRQFGGGQL